MQEPYYIITTREYTVGQRLWAASSMTPDGKLGGLLILDRSNTETILKRKWAGIDVKVYEIIPTGPVHERVTEEITIKADVTREFTTVTFDGDLYRHLQKTSDSETFHYLRSLNTTDKDLIWEVIMHTSKQHIPMVFGYIFKDIIQANRLFFIHNAFKNGLPRDIVLLITPTFDIDIFRNYVYTNSQTGHAERYLTICKDTVTISDILDTIGCSNMLSNGYIFKILRENINAHWHSLVQGALHRWHAPEIVEAIINCCKKEIR